MVSLDYEVYVMARFKFKVYLENKIKFIELEEYQKKTLQEMDIICLEKESYYDLLDDLAYTSDISRSEIKKVYIYDSIKDNEFSIICGNSYIENIIREISNGKKVTETNSYLEMKNYLLDQLENDNYKTFLTEVYNYGNTFQGILSRYATSFHQGVYSEEESKNLQDLKSEILERLAKYKNYRGLAISRKKKEENYLINYRFRYCLLFGNSRNITECTACHCYHHKSKAQGIGIFSVCRFSGFMFYFKLHQHHSCFCFMRIL